MHIEEKETISCRKCHWSGKKKDLQVEDKNSTKHFFCPCGKVLLLAISGNAYLISENAMIV